MKPENGPLQLDIANCLSTIQHEKETIAWCQRKLRIKQTPYIAQIYEDILFDAQLVLSHAEQELQDLRLRHFEWERKRESA